MLQEMLQDSTILQIVKDLISKKDAITVDKVAAAPMNTEMLQPLH